MTLPEVYDLFDYWQENPPEHELVALLARVYSSWKPAERAAGPEERQQALEERWKAGAMNAADLLSLFQKTGGRVDGVAPGPRG